MLHWRHPESGWFKSHYPARGRKPVVSSYREYQMSGSNLITPQGDGNLHLPVEKPMHRSVQISLPRKGTETICTTWLWELSQLFKSHYPARGRKRGPGSALYGKSASSNLITPQGDGNVIWLPLEVLATCSNLITPQGDGNNRRFHNKLAVITVQISLPRKGTETRWCFDQLIRQGRSNLITPQGDGNSLRASPETESSSCSNLITPQGDGNKE